MFTEILPKRLVLSKFLDFFLILTISKNFEGTNLKNIISAANLIPNSVIIPNFKSFRSKLTR